MPRRCSAAWAPCRDSRTHEVSLVSLKDADDALPRLAPIQDLGCVPFKLMSSLVSGPCSEPRRKFGFDYVVEVFPADNNIENAVPL